MFLGGWVGMEVVFAGCVECMERGDDLLQRR